MPNAALPLTSRIGSLFDRLSFKAKLGLLFGIVMPVISALLFPTYVHRMPLPWLERARLLELQFVLSEILVVAWAYQAGMDRSRIWRSLPGDVRIALIALLAVMFISSALISAHPADAMLQSLIQVVHLYFAMAVFHLSTIERGVSEDELTRPLAAGLAVLAIYIAWRFGYPPDPSTLPGGKIEWDFAVPGFISVRYLGTWTGAITAGLAIQLLYRAPQGRVGMYHFYYVLAAAMTIWSGTRAGILGIGAAVFIFVILRGLPQWRAIVMAALLTGLAVALALIFQFDHPLFRLHNSGEATTVSQFTAGRWELWIATVDRWLDSPLLGWGTGSMFYEVYLGWTHTQPHNAFLQFLISWGLAGAIACCWLFARAIRAAHAVAMANRSTWPMLGTVYALLAMSMVDGALYYPRFIIVIVAGLALILARQGRLRNGLRPEIQPGAPFDRALGRPA